MKHCFDVNIIGDQAVFDQLFKTHALKTKLFRDTKDMRNKVINNNATHVLSEQLLSSHARDFHLFAVTQNSMLVPQRSFQ